MGIFSRKAPTSNKLTPTDGPDKFNGQFFYPLFGSNSINWGGVNYLKDFLEVPEVNGIISLKVSAFANGKLKIISKGTGEEVSRNEPLVRALMNPNQYQSQQEFLQQTKFYHEIFGNEILYFLTPVGMPLNVKGLFSISPASVRITEDNSVPFFQTQDVRAKYSYVWGGQTMDFPKDSIIHINRANVNGQMLTIGTVTTEVTQADQSHLWGIPVMASHQANVRNLRAAYEARNVLIENRGALGILSNGSTDGVGSMLPIDPKLKKELQDEYRRYGMTKGQMQIIMTSLNLKWQQMAIDTDKLKLFDECEADTRALCLGYGVPYELIAAGQTYDNKLRAERQFYQNTIIPEAGEWCDAINRRVEIAGKSWEVSITYDHLPVFQDNVKERAQAMSLMAAAIEKLITNGVMTVEQAQVELQKFGIK